MLRKFNFSYAFIAHKMGLTLLTMTTTKFVSDILYSFRSVASFNILPVNNKKTIQAHTNESLTLPLVTAEYLGHHQNNRNIPA